MLLDVAQLLPWQAGEVDAPIAIAIGDGHNVGLIGRWRKTGETGDLVAAQDSLADLRAQDLHGRSLCAGASTRRKRQPKMGLITDGHQFWQPSEFPLLAGKPISAARPLGPIHSLIGGPEQR